MILTDIQDALAQRLGTVVEQVYRRPPAGQPEMPCAIIGFPVVENFHVDHAHCLAQLRIQIKLIVGRGDANDGYDRLAKMLSTDLNGSIVGALEDRKRYPDPPWQRLRCRATDDPTDEGDGIAVDLELELHA